MSIASISSAVPTWVKVNVGIKNGFWTVNGAPTVALSSAQNQTVPVTTLPSNCFVHAMYTRNGVPFAAPALNGISVSIGSDASIDSGFGIDVEPISQLSPIYSATRPMLLSNANISMYVNTAPGSPPITGTAINTFTAGQVEIYLLASILP